ncbi:hypothetical protein U1Q18_047335, partial [Sarracenia purpurea var. burkii]
ENGTCIKALPSFSNCRLSFLCNWSGSVPVGRLTSTSSSPPNCIPPKISLFGIARSSISIGPLLVVASFEQRFASRSTPTSSSPPSNCIPPRISPLEIALSSINFGSLLVVASFE